MNTIQTMLTGPQQGAVTMKALWPEVKAALMAGHRLELCIKPERRSIEQNSRLWASLTDISRQVNWHGQHLSPSEWKDIFTASLKQQKAVPGIDGGFVVLGSSTSQMTRAELSELLDLMYAFGAQRGVVFSDPQEVEA